MSWVNLLVSFITLLVLETVLGGDNIVFISYLSDKLPPADRPKARRWGLFLALFTRIVFLLLVSYLANMTVPLFQILSHGVSVKDLIMLSGGLFLLYKATSAIHEEIEGKNEIAGIKDIKTKKVTVLGVIGTIMVMDVVFSIDSVVTAVGMVNNIPVMVAAILASMFLMILMVNMISDFISDHPTVKMLALSFLLMIGLTLVAGGMGYEFPKGYLYFAMGFSMMVEYLNMRMTAKRQLG